MFQMGCRVALAMRPCSSIIYIYYLYFVVFSFRLDEWNPNYGFASQKPTGCQNLEAVVITTGGSITYGHRLETRPANLKVFDFAHAS